MQPERNPNDWQQPTEQPSQAPYAASPEAPSGQTPIVTITPTPAEPAQQELPAPQQSVPTAEPEPTQLQPVTATSNEELVRWQAHEYVHHEETPIWFIIFTIVVLALIFVAIFLIKSMTFAVLVPVMAAALLVYTHRPPRILDYTLSHQGLHINDRLYSFAEFKGFGVIHDGEEYSVMLLPVKRFRPGISVYFPEEAGEGIVDMLGARLPMQELHLDLVDSIIHKLRI
jgi:hypothetical protein